MSYLCLDVWVEHGVDAAESCFFFDLDSIFPLLSIIIHTKKPSIIDFVARIMSEWSMVWLQQKGDDDAIFTPRTAGSNKPLSTQLQVKRKYRQPYG